MTDCSILFTSTCLGGMQGVAELTMLDTCQILTRELGDTDPYGFTAENWVVTNTSVCGVKEQTKGEALGSTEIVMIDAVLRLPLALQGTFDQTDRIKVTHRYGVELNDLALTYNIISGPERGISALTLKLQKVTDGSDTA